MEGEVEILSSLSRLCPVIHIRKPGAQRQKVTALLEALVLGGADMKRFTIHYDPELALRFSLGGIHLKGDELKSAEKYPVVRLSASAHSWEEAAMWSPLADYVFLSPVFDSISKPGHLGKIDISKARNRGLNNIVALGGIDRENIGTVRKAGMTGAALLGSIWNVNPPESYKKALKAWRMGAVNLQLISDGDMAVAQAFLEGGGRWIQLRMKDSDRETIIAAGKDMAALCSRYDAVMLINDDPVLVSATGAHGVHLGKNDMKPEEARSILGSDKIIGSTANTAEDLEAIARGTTDYIGLGPYCFTTTKNNLSPVLGLEGYRSIMQRVREKGINTPVVAIGGITAGDAATIMESGIDGIAVSGGIAAADNPEAETKLFINEIFKQLLLDKGL